MARLRYIVIAITSLLLLMMIIILLLPYPCYYCLVDTPNAKAAGTVIIIPICFQVQILCHTSTNFALRVIEKIFGTVWKIFNFLFSCLQISVRIGLQARKGIAGLRLNWKIWFIALAIMFCQSTCQFVCNTVLIFIDKFGIVSFCFERREKRLVNILIS